MRYSSVRKLIPTIALCLAGLCGCRLHSKNEKYKLVSDGEAYFAAGKFAEACLTYREALQIDPNFADAHSKLAKCYVKRGNLAGAYREMLSAAELQPKNWTTELDLAQLLLTAGKAKEAKERALLILQSNPSDARAEIILSNADNLLGNYQDALEEARAAVTMAPDRSDPYINIALIEMKSATADAETQLNKAASVDPASITPAMALGTLYWSQQRWTDAEKQFLAAIRMTPQNPTPRAALANLYSSQGQEEHAESVLADAKRQLADDPAAYKMLGYFYLTRGENAKALAEFTSLSAEHPEDVEVRKERVQLLILNHRIDEAGALDKEILKKSPHDSGALVLSAQIDVQLKRYDSALNSLQEVLKSSPSNASAHYYLGVVYQQRSELQNAETEWEKAVQLQPGLIQGWKALATLAAQKNDWQRVEMIGAKMKALAPRVADGYLLYGAARINRGDIAAGESEYQHLIELAPKSALGCTKLGELRVQQKRWNEADILFHQAIAREPGSLDAIQALTTFYFSRHEPIKALEFLQTRIDSDPNNAELYLFRAEAQLQVKKPDEAERSLSRSLELKADNADALTLLAQTEASLQQIDLAIASYRKAIDLAPNTTPLYVSLGSLYEVKGSWPQAEALYRKALAISPEDAAASNDMAYGMLEHGGDPNVALTLAQTARRALPAEPGVADTLGWAYYHVGSFSAAAPLFEEATRKVVNNQTYSYHLALTYERMNDCQRARSEFNKVIGIDPQSHIADKARLALAENCGN
jgi:tetratricopeptide (TPR) repeat protein